MCASAWPLAAISLGGRRMREWVRHVHFVGIGGAGMSGIAQVLRKLDYRVSGSDLRDSPALQLLRGQGAEIFIGHDPAHIAGSDVVVVSGAVPEHNPEVRAARAARVTVIPRAEMLGELMRFRRGIAVAGTHGKTTSTSLIAGVLAGGGLDPTYIVGGMLSTMDGSGRLGEGEYLVAEADESDASFLHLQPLLAVVTNIDDDHLGAYGGARDGLRQAFLEFLHNVPFYGLAVLCADDAGVREILPRIHKPTLTYGLAAAADVRAVDIRPDGLRTRFTARFADGAQAEVNLALPGRHNVQNALAALAVGRQLGVSMDTMQSALGDFPGIKRRFQVHGEVRCRGGTFVLVDDYAHHPRELAATMAAAADAWPERRRVAVFQPHRHSRTRDLLDDFVQVLGAWEPLVLTEVYAAGEKPLAGGDGRALCRGIRAAGRGNPVFVPCVGDLPEALGGIVQGGDVVLLMGAGDIGGVTAEIAGRGLA